MAALSHARRSPSSRRQQPAASGTASAEERAEAEAEERDERERRAAAHGAARSTDVGGDDGGGGDPGRSAALTRLSRSGPASPAAEVRALLEEGDIERTLLVSGRVEDLLRKERAATERVHAQQAAIARLERDIAERLTPEMLRTQQAAWDPKDPRRWLERYARGDGEDLERARQRLSDLRAEMATERDRVERLRPRVSAARSDVLQRADERELQVLRLATTRLREHGGTTEAAAAERLLEDARAEHRRVASATERDVARLDAERERINSDLERTGAGKVAEHAAREAELRSALDEAAAPLAAVRGRMAELTAQRDPRARRRDRRLYARSSAKDLLERSLLRARQLRSGGARAMRGADGARPDGGTDTDGMSGLLAGGLGRVTAPGERLRPGRARQLIGGEGPERRRRHDPETDGRAQRLPRRLRAQERRMARAHARAAAAYERHVRRTPLPALLEESAEVELRLLERREDLRRADRTFVARLAGVHQRLGTAAGRLDGTADAD